ncbi:MAG: hypothetical protein V1865_01785 [bacterium]
MFGIEQAIFELAQLPVTEVVWRILFWYFGWVPIAIAFLFLARAAWLVHVRAKWSAKQKYILLAIDVPNNNDQSPRVIENMLSYIAGAHGTINLLEKWWEGVYQLSFSYETISIDGYIQFIVHIPAQFKNFVETSIYSYYPDAEINEIADYVTSMPDKFPDEEYDMFGSEIKFTANTNALPIRCYTEFEHILGPPEVTYRDPMASLMDLMSSLRKGEQLWYQVLVIPTGFDWIPKFEAEKKKILAGSSKFSIIDYVWKAILGIFGNTLSTAFNLGADVALPTAQKKEPKKMLDLDPGEKKKMEGIQRKIEKMMFEVKIRMIYIARRDVVNKPKVVNGFFGYMKQFNTNDLNGFMPDTKRTMTSANYFRKKQKIIGKQNRIMAGYKERDTTRGMTPLLLNAEEIASIWHLPFAAVVKAPLMQKAAAKRVEAPMTLPEGEQQIDMSAPDPIFEEGFEVKDEPVKKQEEKVDLLDENIFVKEEKPTGTAPDNLPFA